jgi:hypothetical protein
MVMTKKVCQRPTQGRRRSHRFLPQLGEIYFTTVEYTILEIAYTLFRISSMIISYRPYSLVPDPQISQNCDAFSIPQW